MGSASSHDTRSDPDLFRLLVQSIKDYAIFLLDSSGRVATWNEGAERIKGYSAAEILGREYSTFFPPEDVRAGKPDHALRTAASEGRWVDEGWRTRSDGTRFWASAVLTALYQDDTVVGYAKVTRDLTERMRIDAERLELLEKERAARAETELALQRLAAIQRVTERALWHLDVNGLLNDLLDQITDLMKVEESAILLFGDDADGLVVRASRGVTDGEVGHARRQTESALEARVASERRAISQAEIRNAEVTKPGRAGDSASMVGVPLMVSGDVIGVLRVGSRGRREFSSDDIQFLQIVADRMALSIEHARLIESETQARREADIAAETLLARDAFLTIVAHELKTPMTALQLATELLMRREAPDAEADKSKPFHVIAIQLRRLNKIVDRILDTTSSGDGALIPHRRSTNLTRLLHRLVRDARLRVERHDITLSSPDDVRAFVDGAKIEQVFSHLLENAVKFSPDGGCIDIVLGETESGVRVSVRDHGLGVDPEHRPHLFERFHRAHAADYRSGIGLGLNLCKEIVNLHGGTIRAEFPDDGGTRFVVEIPRSPELESRAQTTGRQEVP